MATAARGSLGLHQVLSNDTMLLRFDPTQRQDAEPEDESLMLGLFLDLLTREALTAAAGPVTYTEVKRLKQDSTIGLMPSAIGARFCCALGC